MNITILFQQTNNRFEVSEQSSLAQMQRDCPTFFRTPHGKRETYTVYRGQLIVRYTVQYSQGPPVRETAPYAYLLKSLDDKQHRMPDAFCISTKCRSISQAKRAIDTFLDGKVYSYSLFNREAI